MPVQAQRIGVKTNTLYWLTGTINGGLELALGRRTSLDLTAAYNPWTFKENKKMHFWAAQPELRYWLCERFEGHFFGIHAHGGQFYGGFKEKRYDGYFAGGGISYGYDWILSPHWNLEATFGLGYIHAWYKESPRIPCIKCIKDQRRNYFGPTRLGLTFTYLF